jgi:adenosylcobinamide-GDP ribazoletransferase
LPRTSTRDGVRPTTAGVGSPKHRLADLLLALYAALCFFTVLPVGRLRRPPSLSASAAFLPLVGAGIGVVAGLVGREAAPLLGRAPAAFLAVLLLAGLAGGIHQDGLADLADGLLAGDDRSRRLAVMAEGTVGAFAVLALLAWGIGSFAAAAAVSVHRLPIAFLVAGCWSRVAALLQVAVVPPARPDGLGASFSPKPLAVAAGLLIAAAATVPPAGAEAAGIAFALSAVIAAATGGWARRALGGRTGDTLGGAVALAELAILLAAAALYR